MNSTTPAPSGIKTVLFDLDGTLLDTAPDLAYALNALLEEQGRSPLSFDTIRPHVSHGATAMIRLGFGLSAESPSFAELRQRFLDIYAANISRETRLFTGMEDVLSDLERRQMSWGIVTNKPAFLTEPLLVHLSLRHRAACVISGDTTANKKPHPEPMLLACRQTNSVATECVYVGDAQRDIEAGSRAGMPTLIALYGYIGADDAPETWGASASLNNPADLMRWLDKTG